MEETKPLTLRLKKTTWSFLKKKAVDREMSLAALINECLDKYKKKCEKSLTSSDTLVS
jgi:predicted DNA-binding ribbon-helix-helix protein